MLSTSGGGAAAPTVRICLYHSRRDTELALGNVTLNNSKYIPYPEGNYTITIPHYRS